MINIGTDGACKGNPGIGGWGIAVFEDEEFRYSEYSGEEMTTNNRMELTAFINACDYIRVNNITDVTIHIDSTYVLKGTTEWLQGWIAKDYKSVKNSDLWREVASYRDVWLKCSLVLVKGHSGNVFNDKADEAANEGCYLNNNGGW